MPNLFFIINELKNIYYIYIEHLCVTQRNLNSDVCIRYCQKSVKLWKYVNKLFYHNLAYMYSNRYIMHIHMTVIRYFFHKKIKCGITCVTHFCYVCDTFLLLCDAFLLRE